MARGLFLDIVIFKTMSLIFFTYAKHFISIRCCTNAKINGIMASSFLTEIANYIIYNFNLLLKKNKRNIAMDHLVESVLIFCLLQTGFSPDFEPVCKDLHLFRNKII